MKPLPPILFALVMTGIVAGAMIIIGGSALFNKNSLPVVNSPVAPTSQQVASAANDPQNNQAQQLISQYQQREKQYQTQMNDAAQRLNQANQQLQQDNQAIQTYQQILVALQQRGLISVDQNGQILISRGGRSAQGESNDN
jgi:hypothetical protein